MTGLGYEDLPFDPLPVSLAEHRHAGADRPPAGRLFHGHHGVDPAVRGDVVHGGLIDRPYRGDDRHQVAQTLHLGHTELVHVVGDHLRHALATGRDVLFDL